MDSVTRPNMQRRDDVRGFFGLNGKTGEVLRWLIGAGVAALISYYTALGAIQARVTVVETRQQDQFQEIQRSLTDIKAQVRDLSQEMRGR